MADGITMKVQGIKEIEAMFRQVPKQVSQDKIWARFWRLNTKPLVKAAKDNAPIAKKDVPYTSNPSLTIKKGTLRDSIGFFRTRASKEYLGAYIGPKVKGKFKKIREVTTVPGLSMEAKLCIMENSKVRINLL